MARYRLCYKIKSTSKIIEGDYVITELQIDKYRQVVEVNNADHPDMTYYIEQEPSKLPRTRRPSATMAKRKKGD